MPTKVSKIGHSRKKNGAPTTEAVATPIFKVATTNSVMGIRGTDFMVVRTSALGETELVSFEGSDQFTNVENAADERMVTTGRWGGLRGCFGKSIAPLLKLPEKTFQEFLLSLTFRVAPNPSAAAALLRDLKTKPEWYDEAVPEGF